MCSIYIGQLVQPAASPLIMCMHVCLGGVAIIYYYPHPAVVTAWSLTQAVAGSNPFTIMTNILVTDFSEFNENIYGKLN